MKISSFRDKYYFLSNFYPLPDGVYFEGGWYPTVEHAYQAAKTLDSDKRYQIWQAETPTEAKRLGRSLETLRPDWDTIKDSIMLQLLKQKFAGNGLRDELDNTKGMELEEGNTWHDNYWGKCYCHACTRTTQAENKLGKMLMAIRDKEYHRLGG